MKPTIMRMILICQTGGVRKSKPNCAKQPTYDPTPPRHPAIVICLYRRQVDLQCTQLPGQWRRHCMPAWPKPLRENDCFTIDCGIRAATRRQHSGVFDENISRAFDRKRIPGCIHLAGHRSLQLEIVWNCDISNSNYLIYQYSQFEISKVYDIGLQNYNDRNILVCDKDSNKMRYKVTKL